MKKLLTMFMSLLVIVTLTACSGGSSVAGTYELSEATKDGKLTIWMNSRILCLQV